MQWIMELFVVGKGKRLLEGKDCQSIFYLFFFLCKKNFFF